MELLTPAYYYDLYADIDGELKLIDDKFPVWLTEKDFEQEWINQGRSIIDYKEIQQEQEENDNLVVDNDDNILSHLLFDPVEYYRRQKTWNKFKQGYIEKTKCNLIDKYNLTLYKNGKWLNTVIDTTIKCKNGDDPFINRLRNIHGCTNKLNLKQILLFDNNVTEVKLIVFFI